MTTQTKTLIKGAKTWHFWKISMINAGVASAASSGLTFINNLSASGLGMDAGDMISFKALGVSMAVGFMIGIFKVLSTFKLPE